MLKPGFACRQRGNEVYLRRLACCLLGLQDLDDALGVDDTIDLNFEAPDPPPLPPSFVRFDNGPEFIAELATVDWLWAGSQVSRPRIATWTALRPTAVRAASTVRSPQPS